MPYCTVTIVRSQVVTDLDDATITNLISEVDALIDWKYDLTGVPALVIQKASKLRTAYEIALRDPNSQKVGEYSEDRSVQLKLMKIASEEALNNLNSGGSIESFNESIS